MPRTFTVKTCLLHLATGIVFLLLPAHHSPAAENQPQPAGTAPSVAPAAPAATGAVEIAAARPAAEGIAPLPAQQAAEPEFMWELDPYYSQVSLCFPLTDSPIPETTGVNEFKVYRKLFFDSLIPRYLVVEAAIFPMPLLGVGLKEHQRDFYRGFTVADDVNLLEAVTAGFQEPYAISILIGDMVSFVKPGEKKVSTNKGYMGYMLSYSNQHINHNDLIPDHNLEIEWKLKGERIFKEDKLSWSFRLGTKLHGNPDIADTFYVGIRRSNLDFSADFLGYLNNSTIDFRWDFSARDGRILRQEYVVGKKLPLKRWKVALKMDIGFILESPAKYTGPLRESDFQELSAVIRPNIEF